MRVSTAEQNLALQHDALLAVGIAPERITNRPGMISALASSPTAADVPAPERGA